MSGFVAGDSARALYFEDPLRGDQFPLGDRPFGDPRPRATRAERPR